MNNSGHTIFQVYREASDNSVMDHDKQGLGGTSGRGSNGKKGWGEWPR